MTQAEKFPEKQADEKTPKSKPRRRLTVEPANQVPPFEEVAQKVLAPDPLVAAAAAAEEPGGADKPKAKKAEPYKPPADASDLSDLFVDTGQGDPLTETTIYGIPVDKPKDFFRVHPDPAYRKRCLIYTHKVEGQIEERHYIVAEAMRDKVPEAKLCLLATCIYRNGALRLWPLKLPQEGEKDQLAWSTARAIAKKALTTWTKLVWLGSK